MLHAPRTRADHRRPTADVGRDGASETLVPLTPVPSPYLVSFLHAG